MALNTQACEDIREQIASSQDAPATKPLERSPHSPRPGIREPHETQDELSAIDAHQSQRRSASRRARMEAGDTQVMSSQVLRDYVLNHSKSNPTATGHGTYATGDTGYVDFAGFGAEEMEVDRHSRSPSPQYSDHSEGQEEAAWSEGGSDELGRGQDEDPRSTSRPRFSSITPVAGKKRDRNGIFIERQDNANTSQDLTAMFGGHTRAQQPGMTQLFQNTQAGSSSPTSPANLRSDPVFERPSPDMRNGIRSTPAYNTSSPMTVRKSATFQRPPEPREAYRPLNESQQLRNAEDPNGEQDGSEEEAAEDAMQEDSGVAELARLRRRRTIEQRARNQFQAFATPTPAKLDKRRKILAAQTVIGLVTPQDKVGPSKTGKEAITISSDSKTPHTTVSAANGGDSDDEYDELSQDLYTSGIKRRTNQHPLQSPPADTPSHPQRPNSSPVAGKYGGSRKDVIRDKILTRFNPGISPSSKPQSYTEDSRSQQRACVENSQPDNSLRDIRPARRPLMPSSITSRGFVSQSQLPAHDGRDRDTPDEHLAEDELLETSSIPPPPELPQSSPTDQAPEDQDNTPASSPPLQIRGNSDNGLLLNAPSTNGEGTSDAVRQLADLSAAVSNDGKSKDQTQEPSRQKSRSLRSLEAKVPETSPVTSATRTEHRDENFGRPNKSSVEKAEETVGSSTRQRRTARSEGTNTFVTAPSTMQASASNSTPKSSSRIDLSTTPGSIHRPGIRKMVDIAASQPAATSSDLLNLPDFSILNDDDKQFQTVMSNSSPDIRHSKRKKVTYGKRTSKRMSDEKSADIFGTPASGKYPPATAATLSDERFDQRRNAEQPAGQGAERGLSSTKQVSRPKRDADQVSGDNEGMQTTERTNHVPERVDPATSTLAKAIDHRALTTQQSSKPSRKSLLARISTDHAQPTGDQQTYMHPQRVLAVCNDIRQPGFFPATVLSPAAGTTLKIQYDDGNEFTVEQHLVKRFELREGDAVKVNLSGKKNTDYRVERLCVARGSAHPAEGVALGRDVFGNDTAILQLKRRASMSTADETEPSETETVDLQDIYFTRKLWQKLDNRVFSLASLSTAPRWQSPVDQKSVPSTPTSRTRKGSVAGDAPFAVVTTSNDLGQGVFSRMAFCVSFSGDQEDEKAKILKLITDHGGQILNDGFEQLFERPTSVPTTPSKTADEDLGNTSSLKLTEAAKPLGLVALIADRYSRRIKYVQALALNLPCLHGRWVHDSAASQTAQPLARYLLPAGESKFLGGTIRSRTLCGPADLLMIPASNLKFPDMFSDRARLLEGKNVMLIIGVGKLGERRNIYTFLARVAAARKIQKVKDIPMAKSVLTEDTDWDYILVDDSRVVEATKKLFGAVDGQTKPPQITYKKGAPRASEQSKTPKVIADEVALQSFILGSWYDDA